MDATILKKLRTWFCKNAASLPWRPADLDVPRDPYAVWISETMLQQTQVATVKDYYIRWMERFPDVKTLAKASEEEVFKYWQGLGYYSRARNILKTAGIIANAGGKFPQTRKELEALPGIGAYTAGAILSLACHQKEAILDGNLVRIFSRFFALDFLPTDKTGASETYWGYARAVADSPKAYMHNEALMELGRTVCKSKTPLCGSCPLAGGCRAYSEGRAEEFPPKKKRVQKEWHGTALVIESADGKILAVSAGQAFLRGQLALPHFETQKNATAGIPLQAERYIDSDKVASVRECGTFRHNITVHKIECNVLHIKLKYKAKKNRFTWVSKDVVNDFFANSFSLKALKLALA
jgi:A/G-specific adenine glycosylase